MRKPGERNFRQRELQMQKPQAGATCQVQGMSEKSVWLEWNKYWEDVVGGVRSSTALLRSLDFILSSEKPLEDFNQKNNMIFFYSKKTTLSP